MKFHGPVLASLAIALTLSGCNSKLLSAATNIAATAAGPKVSFSGLIYAPADQVAVIAVGGANVIAAGGANVIAAGGANDSGSSNAGSFSVLARSDERALAGATVTLTPLGGFLSAATAQTDTTGQFTVEVPSGTYVVTATFQTTSNTTITLTGLGFAKSGASPFTLDVAHHLVAAKLLQAGAKAVDEAKFDTCVQDMENDLSSVARTPEPTDQSSAAATFDVDASSDCKAVLKSILGN